MGLVGGDNLYPFMYSAGKGRPLFSENGREFYGNTTEVRDALQVLQDLAQVHGVMRTSGGWTDFAEQTVATLVLGQLHGRILPQIRESGLGLRPFPDIER